MQTWVNDIKKNLLLCYVSIIIAWEKKWICSTFNDITAYVVNSYDDVLLCGITQGCVIVCKYLKEKTKKIHKRQD